MPAVQIAAPGVQGFLFATHTMMHLHVSVAVRETEVVYWLVATDVSTYFVC